LPITSSVTTPELNLGDLVVRRSGVGQPRWAMAQFLATGPEGLRLLYEGRPVRRRAEWDWSPDWTVVESLARVLERQGLQNVGQLGSDAAAAWAHRVGIR
jgi:hypothetical protein